MSTLIKTLSSSDILFINTASHHARHKRRVSAGKYVMWENEICENV